MINIFGGVYRERCFLEISDELYGSGGRAACALSSLAKSIKLHSYFSERSLRNFQLIADAFCIDLEGVIVEQEISFNYFHSLAKPKIFPYEKIIHPPIKKTGLENVLQFGMVEGDSIIEAERVVYDPQSPYSPKWFHENGSKAKSLAYVLNFHEGSTLAGSQDVDEITKIILRTGASAVVLKMGSNGTIVNDGKTLTHISCIETDRVRAIGSGDIFSAIFSYFWLEENEEAASAAGKASTATAFYCNNGWLPIPTDFVSSLKTPLILSDYSSFSKNNGKSKPKVYLAGPFFNMAEIWMVEECRNILYSFDLDVFSPYHDVGIGPAQIVARKDIDALDECQVVFAILNGLDPGTIFEIGYAVSKQIPVVVFVQNEKPENLKMIEGSGCFITDDFSTAIYKTAWAGKKA